MKNKLFCDLKTNQEKLEFFMAGRGYDTGIVAKALQEELITVYSRLIDLDGGQQDLLCRYKLQELTPLHLRAIKHGIANTFTTWDDNKTPLELYQYLKRLSDGDKLDDQFVLCEEYEHYAYSPEFIIDIVIKYANVALDFYYSEQLGNNHESILLHNKYI